MALRARCELKRETTRLDPLPQHLTSHVSRFTASSTSAVIFFKVVSSSSRLASKADSSSSRGTQMGAPQRYRPRDQGYGTMN